MAKPKNKAFKQNLRRVREGAAGDGANGDDGGARETLEEWLARGNTPTRLPPGAPWGLFNPVMPKVDRAWDIQ